MRERLKILITGGAGYVGTRLIPQLLVRSYEVTVFDRLLWGGTPIIPFFQNQNFYFTKGDVRDKNALKKACRDKDVIIHLAAIVGFPACDANPDLAKSTNVGGSKNLASVVSKNQFVLLASSGSNYGRVLKGICTEKTPLRPITLYSKTKTESEQTLMNKTTCTAFRPGTAFGISPRLRLDLLVHQLTLEGLNQKKIILYEPSVIRPFIHVHDFGRVFLFAIDNYRKMKNEIYNLGADELNYTKRQIADEVAKETGAIVQEATGWEDPDKRHYEVSYKKLAGLGYKPTLTVRDGIKELVKAIPATRIYNPYSNHNEQLG